MKKTVIIAGGGYAGVLTAKKLLKKLKKHDVEIAVIDKNPFHTMLTELHEVAAGRVEPSSIIIPFEKIFKNREITFIQDEIISADAQSGKLKCKTNEYDYDYLVVCTGSVPRFFGIEGAEQYSYSLWSFEDALKLRRRIKDCFYKASLETDRMKRKELLSFAVVGGSATGVEMAGELAEYVPILCKEFSVDISDVAIRIIDAADRIMPQMNEKVSLRLSLRLKKLGVRVMTDCKVLSVTENGINITGKPEFIPCKTVIWAAGTLCSAFSSNISGVSAQKNGRIKTDKYLRAQNTKNVYVGGDCLMYEADGVTVPQMVENAEHSAETISENISLDIKGLKQKLPYEPKFHGAMVSCGGRYGSAEVGGNKKYILPSFLAMLVKHLINVLYFIKVAGWNKVSSYLKHEIFAVRNRRSFLGGHFSAKSPTLLLVPLRIFTGVYWLIEAFEKIAEGWLKGPHLASFFKGAYDYFDSASGVVDSTVTAATSAVTKAELVFRTDILGIFDIAFVKGGGDYALRTGFLPTDWLVNGLIIPNESVQMFFQVFIIISELVIGLCLILGLFSFIINGYALVLQAMFLMTTGLYLSTWWLVFASIALLVASGHSLGADYYISPIIKRSLKSNYFTGKWYLYND